MLVTKLCYLLSFELMLSLCDMAIWIIAIAVADRTAQVVAVRQLCDGMIR